LANASDSFDMILKYHNNEYCKKQLSISKIDFHEKKELLSKSLPLVFYNTKY